MKLKWRSILAIPLLIALLGVWLLWPHSKSEAAWYDDLYSYRQKISFTHNAAIADSRSITFSLDTAELIAAGSMQSDCDDTRFTDINGKLLKYQLTGTCNNAATTYEVIFPSIINGSNIGYVYYGNPSATSASQDVSNITALTPSGSDPAITDVTNQETTPGPIGVWKFDEGTGITANDATQNANTGTLTNGPVWKNSDECINGKCLFFDGTNDRVSIPDPSNNNLDFGTGSFTIGAWVRPKAGLTSFYQVIGKKLVYNSSNIGWQAWLDFRSSSIMSLRINDGSSANDLTASPGVDLSAKFSNGSWRYVTWVVTIGSNVKFYVDGQLVGTTSISSMPGSISNSQPVNIGGNNGDFYPGFIDEPKLYNYARTATQIQTDYIQGASNKGSGTSFGNDRKESGLNLTNGLIGYWKMDENTGTSTSDSSGNVSTATLGSGTSAPTWAVGKFGSSLSFDGTNDYASVTSSTYNLTNNFTLSTWVYANTDSDTNYSLISSAAYVTTNQDWWFHRQRSGLGNKLSFQLVSGSQITSNSAIAANTWTHVTVSLDNGTAHLYINGVEDAVSTSFGAITSGNTGLMFGKRSDNTSQLNGKLDDVRIYNRALSLAEVRAMYNFSPAPIGYWKLDEHTGSSSQDSSGNGYTGTLTNGPRWTTGQYSSGVNFDGSDDNINMGDVIDFSGNTPMTIEAWIKPSSLPAAFGQIVSKYDAGNAGEWYLGIENTGQIDFLRECGSFGTTSVSSVSTNSWKHITGTYDGTSLRIYINGVLDKTTADSCSTSNTAVETMIGAGDNGAGSERNFAGIIDDVRIYNYARTTSQIVEDMNGGHPIGGSPVGSQAGYWKFDEGYGDTGNNSGVSGSTINADLGGTCPGATTCPTWSNAGKFGRALSFDGTGDYASIPDNDAIDFSKSQDFTISVWVNLPTTQVFTGNAENSIIDKGSSTNFPYRIRLMNQTDPDAGSFYAARSDSTNSPACGTSVLAGNPTIADNAWHNIVFTKIGSIISCYLDGKLVDSTTDTTTGTTTQANAVFIGQRGDSQRYLTGKVDELKIYGGGLTAEQILVEYNQGQSTVMGAKSTASDGITADNSTSREYCVPGDTSTCSAPIAEWNLNENTGTSANDTSGNGHTGTISGTASYKPGVMGSAVQFDGSGIITIADADDLSFGNGTTDSPFSISGWAYMNNTTLFNIFSKANNSGAGSREYIFTVQNGQLILGLYDNSTSNRIVLNSGTTYNTNQWYFFEGTYDGTGINGMKLYVNGMGIGSTSSTVGTYVSMENLAVNANLGRVVNDAGAYNSGLVDHVRIYNYARTPAQVAWEYNHGGPVAWYRLDECQGTTAYDSSPNNNEYVTGNNGTISIGATGTNTSTGTCNSGTATESWNNGTNGKIKSSISLDGTDDKITAGIGPYNNFGTGDFTISAWIQTTETDSQNCVASITGNATGWRFGYSSNGRPYFLYGDGTNLVETTISTKTINDGTWHHLTEVFDFGNQVSAYIDGNYVGSASISSVTGSISTGSTLWIGTMSGSSGFVNGQVDDLRIYNYALNPLQIKLLYNENSAVRFGPITGSP